MSLQPQLFLGKMTSPRFILPLFSILGLIGILNHAMWRDEMNTWLIVRDSASLGEMLGYVNYQGHPALWALLVALASNIADTPVVMQLLHWFLGTSAVVIFWYFSEFTRLQKILFTFGYLPFFEYFLICRPYVLGMLFVFLFCALYPTRKQTYLWLALSLGLMANSHAFAAIISLAAVMTLTLEFLWDKEQRSHYLNHKKIYDLILSLIILIALYAFAFSVLNPPADSLNVGGRDGWRLNFDVLHLFRVLGRLMGGYVLIIPNSRRWLDLILSAGIGLSMVSLIATKLSRNRTPFFFYLLSTGGLLSFFYLRYLGHGARHYGFVYLILIASLWLAQYHEKADWLAIDKFKLLGKSLSVKRACSTLLTVVLLFHLGGGLYRFSLDLVVPLSAGKAAAQYIRESELETEFIMASPDVNMATVSGYLGQPLYYPELQGMGSFTIYQEGRRTLVEQPDVLEQAHGLLPGIPNCRILLVLREPLEAQHPDLALTSLITFEKSWISGERMYLYWLTSKEPSATCEANG